MLKKSVLALGAALLSVPLSASAQAITEIMYDLEGGDSGREWIEIFNDTSAALDLSTFKFFENDTNHKLVEHTGGVSVAPNAYAIVADKPDVFLAEHSDFSGIVLDSSFSLSNFGETLELRDSELSTLDSVNYTSEWGALGNGNSLQKSGSEWFEAPPSPGEENIPLSTAPAEETDVAESGDTNTRVPPPQDTAREGASIQTIFAEITESPETAVVGAAALFDAAALGLMREPLGNARYVWVFGDGAQKEGKRVLHTYRHPGEYVVMVHVASGEHSTSDRVNITAREARVTLTGVIAGRDGFIELTNNDTRELDLSGWFLHADGARYLLPRGTVVLSGRRVRFSAQATGLDVAHSETAALLYPNGEVAAGFEDTKENTPLPAPTRTSAQRTTTQRAAPIVAVRPRLAPPQAADTPIAAEGTALVAVQSPESVFAETAQAASKAHADGPVREFFSGNIAPWLLALAGLIVTAFIAVVFGPKEDDRTEGYAIIEEE